MNSSSHAIFCSLPEHIGDFTSASAWRSSLAARVSSAGTSAAFTHCPLAESTRESASFSVAAASRLASPPPCGDGGIGTSASMGTTLTPGIPPSPKPAALDRRDHRHRLDRPLPTLLDLIRRPPRNHQGRPRGQRASRKVAHAAPQHAARGGAAGLERPVGAGVPSPRLRVPRLRRPAHAPLQGGEPAGHAAHPRRAPPSDRAAWARRREQAPCSVNWRVGSVSSTLTRRGACTNDTGGTDAGAAYLVLGSASPIRLALGEADAQFTDEAGNYAGISVSTAGDVDGDGFDDVLVGAVGTGAAYPLFGTGP